MNEESEFCAAPFVQMVLAPSGSAHPCCYQLGFKLGDIRHETIDAIWTGNSLRKLRNEFLGGAPKTCAKKMSALGCHREFERFGDRAKFALEQNPRPIRLDLRLGGKCNLQCLMCDVWEMPNDRYTEENFWGRAEREFFPFVDEVDILGGEPFVQKDTFRILEYLRDVNPRCKVGFVSNGHYSLSPKICAAIEGSNLRMFQLSLDSLEPETYSKIRVKGELKYPLSTLEYLIDLRKRRRFELRLSLCVQRLNWKEVPAFLDFCEARQLFPVLQQLDYDPSGGASLGGLGIEQKAIVIEFLESTVRNHQRKFVFEVVERLKKDVFLARKRRQSV